MNTYSFYNEYVFIIDEEYKSCFTQVDTQLISTWIKLFNTTVKQDCMKKYELKCRGIDLNVKYIPSFKIDNQPISLQSHKLQPHQKLCPLSKQLSYHLPTYQP